MAADIVNLRQFRKQKARSEKEKQAEQNRLSFGRTKTEKSYLGPERKGRKGARSGAARKKR